MVADISKWLIFLMLQGVWGQAVGPELSVLLL